MVLWKSWYLFTENRTSTVWRYPTSSTLAGKGWGLGVFPFHL